MNENTINEIIAHYPYPIAILYRIIAGMDLEEEPGKGLTYILQTAEAVARLLGTIALSELVLLKEKEDIDIPPGIQSDFKRQIKRPSFGIWLQFAREGFSCFRELDAEIVIPEMKNLFYDGRKETEFKASLDRLVKLRNAIAHGKVVLDTIDRQQSAVNIALTYLHTVLSRLDFLKGVSFGYIKTIEVSKRRRQAPSFLHKGKTLKGDCIGKGINLSSVLVDFKETDTVIIRYDQTHYLNLYPFYIYDESAGDAADVFFYNGMENKDLEYIGIDPGGKFRVKVGEPDERLGVDEAFDLLLSGAGRQRPQGIKYSPELHEEFTHIYHLLG